MLKKFIAVISAALLLMSFASCKKINEEPLTQQTVPPTENQTTILDTSNQTIPPSTPEQLDTEPDYSEPEFTIHAYVNSMLTESLDSYIDVLTVPAKHKIVPHEGFRKQYFHNTVNRFNDGKTFDDSYFHIDSIKYNPLPGDVISEHAKEYKNFNTDDISVSEAMEVDAVIGLKTTDGEEVCKTVYFVLLNENGNWKIDKALIPEYA
jgi:hypothetical protein